MLVGSGLRLVGHLPLRVREVGLDFELEAAHVLGQGLKDDVGLFCEDRVVGLLVVLDFNKFARILDFAF